MYHFRRIRTANGDIPPPLHPSLAALFIVIKKGADFSEISRNHPNLRSHIYYKPRAKFPEDISNLLPPAAERWWVSLGESRSASTSSFSFPRSHTAASARQGEAAPTLPAPVPRVRLILPPRTDEPEDVEMELDELNDDEYVPVSDFIVVFSHILTVATSPPPSVLPRPGRLPRSLQGQGSERVPCCRSMERRSARLAHPSGSPPHL